MPIILCAPLHVVTVKVRVTVTAEAMEIWKWHRDLTNAGGEKLSQNRYRSEKDTNFHKYQKCGGSGGSDGLVWRLCLMPYAV